ncbi:MAG: MoaD/ThiS family protein [Gammaproteobacteria bacterium]|nr:MoaD/ThiS family protein [Gammaproteobacteria bacterium]
MSITVRFFASIRERLGKGEAVIDVGNIRTVADVWARAAAVPLPARLLAAVNLEHARLESPVRDGDEVGFFPPVTGGSGSSRGGHFGHSLSSCGIRDVQEYKCREGQGRPGTATSLCVTGGFRAMRGDATVAIAASRRQHALMIQRWTERRRRRRSR